MKLIDKDAVLAEIKELSSAIKIQLDCKKGDAFWIAQKLLLERLKGKVNSLEVIEVGVDLGDPKGDKSAKYIIDTKTLEVKEVGLEKVFNDEYSKFSNDVDAMDYGFPIDLADYKDFAKHFFELGLSVSNKAQKGE